MMARMMVCVMSQIKMHIAEDVGARVKIVNKGLQFIETLFLLF